mmetsp:Transcript_34290/g.74397  ORF Transcript_34290/g.74397 Transcript_34290/m.74397 type:complete len:389 (-) Transcript_34290:140-1306(-)
MYEISAPSQLYPLTRKKEEHIIMAYLKPAAALLGLIYADPFKLSLAEKVRKEEALDTDRTSDVIANLVLDAEFHRAMMQTGVDSQDTDMKGKILAKMRARRAELMHKRSMVVGARNVASGGTDKDATSSEVSECVPTSTDHDVTSNIDVGVLSSSSARDNRSCQVGYVCIPASQSSTGGHCVPVSTPQRILEDQNATENETEEYCAPGCPTDVCDCFGSIDEKPECADAFLNSCKDGSLVNNCYGNADPVYQANALSYCDMYACLDDKGLLDPASDGFCDSTDPDCAECYCSFYGVACAAFTPLCGTGSEYSACNNLDYACALKECCDAYGAESCFIGTDAPTAEPTVTPTSGAAALMEVGVVSRSRMLGNVLVGGAVLAPAVANMLF